MLLGETPAMEFEAVQVIPPATAEQKRGFVVLSGSEALDRPLRERIVACVDPSFAAVGIEVALGAEEGLGQAGVVRVALPREGKIFCTWIVTLSRDALFARAGVLSTEKLHELENALRL